MKYDVEINNKTNIDIIKKKLYKLNLSYLKSSDKVAYYYEDIASGVSFSYNKNQTFYAASAIKF